MGLWGSITGAAKKAYTYVRNIGPKIQGNNYGTGTTIGGTTYKSSGSSTTTTGKVSSVSSGSSASTSVGTSSSSRSSSGGGSSSSGGITLSQGGLSSSDSVKATFTKKISTPAKVVSSGKIEPAAQQTPKVISINPQTNKPYGTIEPASTKREQYKKYTQEQGYLLGSLAYLGQKSSGFLSSSKYSPVKDSGYQEEVGLLSSKTIEYAPYFSPAGSYLMVGTAAENIALPSGRQRIDQTATILQEEKGWSSAITKPAIYASNIGIGILGAKGIKTDVNKLLKLPATETKVLGVTQQVNKNKIITTTFTESDTKGLLGSKKTIGVSKTITDIKKVNGKFKLGDSSTFGSFTKPKLNLARWKWEGGKIQEFNVLQRSIIRDVGKKGSAYLSGGKGAVGKDIFGKTKVMKKISLRKGIVSKEIYTPTKTKKFSFASAGGTFSPTQKVSLVAGKTKLVEGGKLLRTGSGKQAGVIFRKSIKKHSGSSSSFIKKLSKGDRTSLSQTFKQDVAFPKEVLKSTQATSSATAKYFQPSTSTFKATPAPTRQKTITRQVKISPSIKVMEKEKQVIDSKIKQVPLAATKTRSSSRSGQRSLQVLKTEQLPKQKISQKSALSTKQTQKLILKTPIITPTPHGNIIPPWGGGGGGWFSFSKPPIKETSSRKFFKGSSSFVYRKPSLVAFGLNIKAPKIKGRESAFSIRPIITKKKKKKRKR